MTRNPRVASKRHSVPATTPKTRVRGTLDKLCRPHYASLVRLAMPGLATARRRRTSCRMLILLYQRHGLGACERMMVPRASQVRANGPSGIDCSSRYR